jgi:DGQHR domain-containing protein
MPQESEKHTSAAIRCTQNEQDFYIASIPSDILQKVCYVSRRDEDPVKGFQRVLNEGRAQSIAKYLQVDRGQIPSPLILSAKKEADFGFRSNKISFQTIDNVFLVLDGQHRLYGLSKLEESLETPVVIFSNLTLEDEVRLFIDINTNQKGVSTSLLLDIQSLRGDEAGREAENRRLFDLVNSDSPLSGLLSSTKSARGKISRKTFYDFINPIHDSIYLESLNTDGKYKGIRNYLQACNSILTLSQAQRQKLYNSVIFKAFMTLFPEILERCYKRHENFKEESFLDVLKPASSLDFDGYTGTNNVTLNRIITDIKRELLKAERSESVNSSLLF